VLASIIDEKVLSKTTKHAKDAKDDGTKHAKDAKDDGNEEKEGILVLPLTRSNIGQVRVQGIQQLSKSRKQ